MSNAKIQVDIRQVRQIGEQLREGSEISLRRATERGEQLLRHFVPKQTHNLEQGISSDVTVRPNLLQGNLVVAARTGRQGSRKATLHLVSGKTKSITLRGVARFDYGEAVARGTGIYGPEGTPIVAKRAKVLLVPMRGMGLNGKPEAFIEVGGEKYVMRRQIKGMRPRPYDQLAANQLEREIPGIVDKTFNELDLRQ